MRSTIDTQVAEIRAASRLLVRQLGFMSRNVAGTDLSPSAVHAIVEIDAARGNDRLTAKELGKLLLLEKSTVSRLIQSLVVKSLVAEEAVINDARAKHLRLTRKGQRMRQAIDQYAHKRVSESIAPMNASSRDAIIQGLRLFSEALEQSRHNGK